jgi:hypothetical protein
MLRRHKSARLKKDLLLIKQKRLFQFEQAAFFIFFLDKISKF